MAITTFRGGSLGTVNDTTATDTSYPVAEGQIDNTAGVGSNGVGDLVDNTPGTYTYQLAGAGVSSISGGTVVSGPYGQLIVATDGRYQFTPDVAAVNALPAGMQTASYTVAVTDDDGDTASQTFTVQLNGAVDGVQLTGGLLATYNDTGAADGFAVRTGRIDNNSTATTTGAGQLTGDTGSTYSYALTGAGVSNSIVGGQTVGTEIVGTYGKLVLATDGRYQYVPDNTAINAVAAGSNPTDTFTVQVIDSNGTVASNLFTVQVNGATENQITLTGGSLASYADTSTSGESSALTTGSFDTTAAPGSNGTVGSLDGGTGVVSYALTGTGVVTIAGGTQLNSAYGLLTVATDGRYQFEPNSAAIDTLPAGQQTVSYSVQATDANGTTSTATYTVDITGVNDPVSLTTGSDGPNGVLATYNDTAATDVFAVRQGTIDTDPTAATNGVGQLTGDVGTHTYTLSGGTEILVGEQVVGTQINTDYGTLIVATDGRYEFVPDNAAINALPEGAAQSVTVTITVAGADGSTSSDLFTVEFTGATENQITLTGGSLASYADTSTSGEPSALTTGSFDTTAAPGSNGTVGSLDGGTGVVSYALTGTGVVTIAGGTQLNSAYGLLTVATDGRYQFEPNSAAIDTLPAGQQTVSYSVQATDANGTTSTATYTVDITGVSDPVSLTTGSDGPNGVLATYNDTAATDVFAVRQGTIDTDPTTVTNGVGQLTGDVGTHTYTLSGGTEILVGEQVVGTQINTDYGTLIVATDGRYEFVPDNAAINALPEGAAQSVTVTITVAGADGSTSSDLFTVEFTGAQDAAPTLTGGTIATYYDESNSFAVTQGNFDTDVTGGNNSTRPGDEGTTTVGSLDGGTGAVSYALIGAGVSDVVVNGQVVGHQIDGTYGMFTVANDGRYQFVPHEVAINALLEGQNPVVDYSVQVTDANGTTSTATYSIDLVGAADGPIINNEPTTSYYTTLTETNAALTSMGKVEATDPSGTTLTYSHSATTDDTGYFLYDNHLSYFGGQELTATQQAALTSAFTVNAQTGEYTFNLASPDFLDPGQTLEAYYTVHVTNQTGEEATQTIEIDIRGAAEQGPVGTSGDDTLTLASGAFGSIINGGSGDDIITGGAGNDILRGQSGDDIIQGGTGFNSIDGGSGTDIGILEGDVNDYYVYHDGATVFFYNESTRDYGNSYSYREVHQFVNVESFQFADGTVIDASNLPDSGYPGNGEDFAKMADVAPAVHPTIG